MHSKGFSLLELLLALTLSLFLLGAMAELYVNYKKHYWHAKLLADLQTNLRLSTQILQNDLATTSYIGCGKLNAGINIVHDDNQTPSLTLMGYSSTAAINKFSLPHSGKAAPMPDSDVIELLKSEENVADLIEQQQGSLIVSSTPTFKANDWLLITDCHQGEFFQATQVSVKQDQQYITPAKIQLVYVSPAQVAHVLHRIYYVGDTGRKNQLGQTITALYRYEYPSEKIELIDDVIRLQVYYGISSSNGTVSFITETEVMDWTHVVCVELILTIATEEPILTQAANSDGRVFQTIYCYIHLRNGVGWL